MTTMLKIKPIQNFLLLKYKRKELITPPNDQFSKDEKELYLQCQDVLFYRTIDQIQFFHPKAHIHVLTNENLISTDKITFYIHREVWTNLICKFKLYSLIQEPALFIDLDVIFTKPMPPIEHYSNYPFCFFNTSWGKPLQEYSAKKLPVNQNVIYNSGITWINNPHKNITNELLNLHEIYFSNSELIYSKNLWPDNDEHALSLFIGINKYIMPLNDEINMSRNKLQKLHMEINTETIKKFQSIHYNGITTKQKMIKEYKFYEISKLHTNQKIKRLFNI